MQLLVLLMLAWINNIENETGEKFQVYLPVVQCENGFVRRYGESGLNEECYYLIPDGSGNYFLAGKNGSNSLILQLDPSGNILAQRTYDFTANEDFISNLMVDDVGFFNYLWSNGSTAQTITAQQPGTYAATVTDNCGSTQTDNIMLAVPPGPVVNIGFDAVEICMGESFEFSVSGFQSYLWAPAALVDCPTCPAVSVAPTTDVCISVEATNESGCTSADTVCIAIVTDTADVFQNRLICEGDSIDFYGTALSQPGMYLATDTSGNCVEIWHLTLDFYPKTQIEFLTETACPFAFDGVVTALPNGGAPPYTYEWEVDTVTTNQLSNLDVGTYSVSVTDASSCVVVDSVELGAATRPSVSSEAQAASCFGVNDGAVTFITDDPNLMFTFLSQTPSSQSSYDSLGSGGYQYFVIDTFGCKWVQFFNIDAPDKIIITLPSNIEAPSCDSVQIEASVNITPFSWNWSPVEYLSCSNCPDPIASPFTTTLYHLTVVDSIGCSAIDSIRVLVDFDGKTYIPNVFSPNDDNINDFFHVHSYCVAEVRLLRIFDRWGDKVFEASNTPPNNPLYGWDGSFRGKPMNPGLFVYYVEVELFNGTMMTFEGGVTLLR